MDEHLTAYFAAWNETDAGERGRLLERSFTVEAELVDPTGHWCGLDGISERIGRYQADAPGTKVVPGSGVDAHHDVERYAWKIVDPSGNAVMEGFDVAERDREGRLSRVLMFHGLLPPGD